MKKVIKNKKFVYLVGHRGPEHNFILSVNKSYNGAFKAWNKLRLDLLEEAKQKLKSSKEDAKRNLKKGRWSHDDEPFSKEIIEDFKEIAEMGDSIYLGIIKNLSCEDPEKIDNYSQDTPYINKKELKD